MQPDLILNSENLVACADFFFMLIFFNSMRKVLLIDGDVNKVSLMPRAAALAFMPAPHSRLSAALLSIPHLFTKSPFPPLSPFPFACICVPQFPRSWFPTPALHNPQTLGLMATTAGDRASMYDRAYKNDRHLAGDRNAARERARCCHTTGVVCPLAGATTELTLHIPVYHGRPPLPHRPPVVRVRVLHGGDSTSAPEFDESQNMIRTVPTMLLRYGPIQRAGPFLLAIEVDGAHVMGSPFSLHCRSGAAVANKSSFDAAAYTVRAGEPAHLMFTCRDSFGNRCHEGGALVTVHNASPEDDPDALGAAAWPDAHTFGPQEGALLVLDRGDGSYAAVVTLRRTGMRCFHGRVNGIAVARPVRLHVQPAPLHAPNCVPYGDALECFVAAGVPTILKLRARDV